MANKTKAYCANCKQHIEGINMSFPGGFPKVKCPQCDNKCVAPLTPVGQLARTLGIGYILVSLGLAINDGALRFSLDTLFWLLLLLFLIFEMAKDFKIKKQYKKF